MKRLTSALTILAVGMVMTSVATAQDVDAIKQATLEHFATLTAGNAAAHVAHHMPAVSSFDADGGLLSEAESREAQHMVLQADLDGGLKLNLELRHLKVNVYGDAAVVTGYVVGTVTLPDGSTQPVNDRRTAVLIRHGGEWKEVHTHTSNLTTSQQGLPDRDLSLTGDDDISSDAGQVEFSFAKTWFDGKRNNWPLITTVTGRINVTTLGGGTIPGCHQTEGTELIGVGKREGKRFRMIGTGVHMVTPGSYIHRPIGRMRIDDLCRPVWVYITSTILYG